MTRTDVVKADTQLAQVKKLRAKFIDDLSRFSFALMHADGCSQKRFGFCDCGTRYAQIMTQFFNDAEEAERKEKQNLLTAYFNNE